MQIPPNWPVLTIGLLDLGLDIWKYQILHEHEIATLLKLEEDSSSQWF